MELRCIGLGLFVWVALAVQANSVTEDQKATVDYAATARADCPDRDGVDCEAEQPEDDGRPENEQIPETYFAPVGGNVDTPSRVFRLPMLRKFEAVTLEFRATRRLGRNASGARLDRVLALSRCFAATMSVVALPRQPHAPPVIA